MVTKKEIEDTADGIVADRFYRATIIAMNANGSSVGGRRLYLDSEKNMKMVFALMDRLRSEERELERKERQNQAPKVVPKREEDGKGKSPGIVPVPLV